MFGGDAAAGDEEQEEGCGLAGIVPRAIADLFEMIEQCTWRIIHHTSTSTGVAC
jgi:hypothetical protein